MCKINCSGGCIECAPEEHIKNLQEQVTTLTKERDFLLGKELLGSNALAAAQATNAKLRELLGSNALAAAQATNAKLRDHIAETTTEDMHGKVWRICCCTQAHEDHADHCILALHNDTALDALIRAAKIEALKEAANKLDPTEAVSGSYSAWLRRMADEIEKGE